MEWKDKYMVDSICVPNSTLDILIKNNCQIEFLGFTFHDFWNTIRLTEKIADVIISNDLQWRYNQFAF